MNQDYRSQLFGPRRPVEVKCSHFRPVLSNILDTGRKQQRVR
eukprot:CAMPEP_0113671250 /NCGR_PEP_ID=MMETSP0038_2-20120614/5602_1 /TAXON_ID=2898 /ORGANISM="Cryptomonas paramecium" /LENGTH=41 /DNA_ID=CAMNT_0000587385 /DNA_START=458 /DNA_END=583 /DNA_ORIENTATION=+ /assembly_acc=CAM_ASM_000170